MSMGTVKVSTTLDADRVVEAKTRVGERGFSRYLNEALAMRLQRARLEDLESELVDEYGPISDESRRRIEALEWPR